MTSPNDPAFPDPSKRHPEWSGPCDTRTHPGMSMREYAAIKAMHGLLANTHANIIFDLIAKDAVAQADILLAELGKAK